MLSLAAPARAALKVSPILSTALRRPISNARGNDPKRKPTLIDNAPGWNEDLATASEAFVKADRDTTTHGCPTNAMQRRTVDYVQSRHRTTAHDADSDSSLTTSEPDADRTHATYARDEVGGPLGNAGMGEFEGVVGHDDLGPDDAQVESDGRVVTRRVVGEPGPDQAH